MNYFRGYIYFFIFSIIIGYIVFSNDGVRYDIYVILSSFIIILFSLFKIFTEIKNAYSLNLIVFLFSLFFLGVAPALQYKEYIGIWTLPSTFSNSDYFNLNILIFFILFIYNYVYKYLYQKDSYNYENSFQIGIKSKSLSQNNVVFLTIIASFIFFYSRNFNFLQIIFRGIANDDLDGPNIESTSLSLILNIFIRPIPIVCLVLVNLTDDQRSNFFLKIFLILMCLMSNSPLGMPRFQAAALYIPVLISYVGFFKRPFNFSLTLCFGLLIIFPFLDQFRRVSINDISFRFKPEMFLEAHFDSFQNFMHLYLEEIVSHGNQLLGVLFFFIPRIYWQSKPIGSGAYFSNLYGYEFTNVSMNFFGEGYINFGYIGILIFTILLSIIASSFDKRFWKKSNIRLDFKAIYLFLLGMVFFVLRGDLLSSFAYTIGLIFSIKTVYYLIVNK